MSDTAGHIALKELLYKMADDLLILGHRNSEWTGIGPLLEEDIAFSSMAQDKIGQSLVLYQLLQQLGDPDPDTVAFARPALKFHCCQLVELPIGEYQFSLVRHFLFDHAMILRFQELCNSSFEPLAQIARKLVGEQRYHVMHANSFIKKLGSTTETGIFRMQKALEQSIPYALGIFEESPFEPELIDQGVFAGEKHLFSMWHDEINKVIDETQLKLPDLNAIDAEVGGRIGKHTEHLQPLLDEMAEVIKLDPEAEW